MIWIILIVIIYMKIYLLSFYNNVHLTHYCIIIARLTVNSRWHVILSTKLFLLFASYEFVLLAFCCIHDFITRTENWHFYISNVKYKYRRLQTSSVRQTQIANIKANKDVLYKTWNENREDEHNTNNAIDNQNLCYWQYCIELVWKLREKIYLFRDWCFEEKVSDSLR